MKTRFLLSTFVLLGLAAPTFAQRARPKANAREMSAVPAPKSEQIAWFSTLESGRAEAKRTGKPILFLSARPACQGVPGFW